MSPKTCPTPRIPQDQRNPREIESRLATGEIRRVRRSTYIPASPDAPDFTTHRTIREVLLRVVRTERLDGVVALETAALLHGGRALYEPAAVHLIVGWNAAGLRRASRRRPPNRPASRALGPRDRRRALGARPFIRHRYELAGSDIVELDGLRVTSLERTAEDCARFLPPNRALAVVDSLFAIAAGAGDRPWDHRPEIDAEAARFRRALIKRLDARPHERGVRRARAVVMAATPWSQSVWETEARRLCLIGGIAAPQPQMPVRTEAGVFYADLGWRAAMLAYEIDGEIKYLQDADAALSAQYRRETVIEAAGVHVERATPADVADGEGFLTGLRGVLPQSLCEENPVTALRTPFEIRRQDASW